MPSSSMVSMDELPAYSDSAYVEIDGNQPSFTDADKQETEAFEEYSDLDYLGRCGTAYANVCLLYTSCSRSRALRSTRLPSAAAQSCAVWWQSCSRKFKENFKKVLTESDFCDILIKLSRKSVGSLISRCGSAW